MVFTITLRKKKVTSYFSLVPVILKTSVSKRHRQTCIKPSGMLVLKWDSSATSQSYRTGISYLSLVEIFYQYLKTLPRCFFCIQKLENHCFDFSENTGLFKKKKRKRKKYPIWCLYFCNAITHQPKICNLVVHILSICLWKSGSEYFLWQNK